jgi:hypothetical protein
MKASPSALETIFYGRTQPKKPMSYSLSIEEIAHDLAAIIVTKERGNRDSWEINLGEGQFILMATAPLFGITIFL